MATPKKPAANPLLRDVPLGFTAGDDFEAILTGTKNKQPVDMSGRTFTAELRPRPGGDLVATFTIDTTDADQGKLVLSLDHDDTGDIDPGVYRWDILQEDQGKYRTIMSGHCVVAAPITEA